MCGDGRVVNRNVMSYGQSGLTLIEIMVTLVVLALLVLLGVSLGSDWINGARTQQARSNLVQGWGVANALALRNPCQSVEGQAAAVLTMEHLTQQGYQLRVDAGGDASSCSFAASLPTSVWSALLPAGVQVRVDGVVLPEGALRSWRINNRGLPVDATDISALVVERGGAQNDEFVQWQ